MLIVLDGYGEGDDYQFNAVTRSETPFIDELRKRYPKTLLKASGQAVGLPKGTMGGSEVGHFTMGCGRIVYQFLEEINRSIDCGEFFKKKELKELAKKCMENDSKMHFIGMISDAGVHSHIDHLFALLDFAKKEGLEKVYIHAITDGRDVGERSVKEYFERIEEACEKYGIGKIATVVGRYYAMDRDSNFDRTEKAFKLFTEGEGEQGASAVDGVEKQYDKKIETDSYVEPIILERNGLIEKDDAVVFFNFRTDRAKQLTEQFVKEGFDIVCFGPYSTKAPVLFQTESVHNNLSAVLSASGLKQLRVCESEKYAHVTFFFNSQIKEPFEGEEHVKVPSPKVASYDEKPEMSSYEMTDELLKKMSENEYPLIVMNFANTDLVAHSGNFEATVKAVESVDQCLEKVIPKALDENYFVILTADHGNCEFMKFPNGDACPSHTTNPVVCIFVSKSEKDLQLVKDEDLGLKDVAPTILDVLGLSKPKEMTGNSMIEKDSV